MTKGREFYFCFFFLKIRVFFLFYDRVQVQVVVGSGGGLRVSRTQFLGLPWLSVAALRLQDVWSAQGVAGSPHCPSRLSL